jgi:hypothetical protein
VLLPAFAVKIFFGRWEGEQKPIRHRTTGVVCYFISTKLVEISVGKYCSRSSIFNLKHKNPRHNVCDV